MQKSALNILLHFLSVGPLIFLNTSKKCCRVKNSYTLLQPSAIYPIAPTVSDQTQVQVHCLSPVHKPGII